MAAFRPHGLIRTSVQQQLYSKARIANVSAGIANPKEPETVALMEVLLYRNIFTEPNFIINSQQPPTPTSDRRCDLMVRYIESGYENIRILLFAKCKRTSTSQEFSLKALEIRALDYCQLHLKYEKDSTFVYAATMAGAHVRLWRSELGPNRWVPLWGPNHEGDWGQYKDVGCDSAGLELERWFEGIKGAPRKLDAGQDFDTYGTSYQTGTSSASGFQANTPWYQTATSGYRPSGYPVSYLAPSGASTDQYMHSDPAYQTNPGVQTGQSTDEPFGEEDEGGEDNEEGEKTDGDAEAQQTASSRAESKYHVVRVSKKSHKSRRDEFIFKNAKGKRRSTERKDWQEITTSGGQRAWKYCHYVTYDLPS